MRRNFQSLRNAFMAVLPMLGRFGATRDNSPERFMPAVEITGTGAGKAATRHKRPRRTGFTAQEIAAARSTVDHQQVAYFNRTRRDERRPQIVGSMRGDDWLRNNRRRRSAGLPQLRRFVADGPCVAVV